MFKKAVKKQTIKFDEEDENIDADNNNNVDAEVPAKEKLDLRAIKAGQKKVNKPTGISFDEEKPMEEFTQRKKPLAQQITNLDIEENNEKPVIGQTSSYKSYIDELKKSNLQPNETALEMIRNMKELQQLGHDEEELIEREEIQLPEFNENEDEELNEDQMKEIEDAKKYREKKRKLNSGDYISLKKDNDDFDNLMMNKEKERIKMNVLGNKEIPRDLSDEDMDPEEADEVNEWENQILKKAINSKTMSNINNFVKKQYTSTKTDGSRADGLKRITSKEVDLDFILRQIDENIKTGHANYDYDVERITQLMNWIQVSEDQIGNYQSQYNQNAQRLELFQDIMDYMNDITDCIAEKMESVEEAESTLEKIEENYADQFFQRIAFNISDQIEESGGHPLTFGDSELNIKLKGQKAARKQQRDQQEQYSTIITIESIFSDQDLAIISDPTDEVLGNMKYDKSAIYLAAKDIFADVIEDYTDAKIIINKFNEFKKSCDIEHSKLVSWLSELLAPFAVIDLIGYDPLRYTDIEHRYHGIESFLELDYFAELATPQIATLEVETNLENESGVEIRQLKADVLDDLLGRTVKDKLVGLIKNLWNPFSIVETQRLTTAINRFIQIYYVNNPKKDPAHLEKIKELLQHITEKFKKYLDVLVFPPVSNSKIGYQIYLFLVRLLRAVLSFKGILPASNIIQISLETIMLKKILPAIKDLKGEEQIQIFSKIFALIPQDILENEKIKVDLSPIKEWIQKVITTTLSSPSLNDPSRSRELEETKRASTSLKEILKIN